MVEKIGRYGKYLACSGYPECRNIMSLKDAEKLKGKPEEKADKDQ